MTTSAARCEVAVVGGGLVGSSLALALAQQGRSVTLIERALPPESEPRWDERCIALNARTRQILTSLGVWEAIATEAVPITATHISERGRFGVTRFSADEAGLDALGHNVPIRHVGRVLWDAVTALGVPVVVPASVVGLQDTGHALRLDLDGDASAVEVGLVAAADGAQSAVRALQGIDAVSDDYGQSAIVTAVRVARPLSGMAYERFTPEGPIALLPKAGDARSLIWTLPTAMAQHWMSANAADFLAAIQAIFGERLGRFTAVGHRSLWPLRQVRSTQLTAPRTVFLGNAAHALHPVAAQGFNLGLRDVAALVDISASVASLDDADVLARYAAARAADSERTAGFTDGLIRLFSNRLPGLQGARHLGLLGLSLLPPVKRAVLWQNLGFGGSR